MKRRSFTFRGKRSPSSVTTTMCNLPLYVDISFLIHDLLDLLFCRRRNARTFIRAVNKDSRWNTRSEKSFNFNDIFDAFFNEEKRYTNSIQAFKHLSSCSIFQSQSIAYPFPFPPYPAHPPSKLSRRNFFHPEKFCRTFSSVGAGSLEEYPNFAAG